MPNRLAGCSSPYLLQHKDNPVDWFPWGEEAFEKARTAGKPVFLSIGYSSCHWCHVMAHESFEDDDVAALLNEHFISVKVDREERPDVDDTYMMAVQLSSGHGGWPLTAFLTPDKKPFFAATYFPKEDHDGRPGLKSILRQVATGWKDKRDKFENVADEFSTAISSALGAPAPLSSAVLDGKLLEKAIQAMALDFDEERGGFGVAPKFPPHSAIALLLRYALSEHASEELAGKALGMALLTLEAMAIGGLRDHVGGGFHRYSTDEFWLLPHFEKMLYDNALHLENYSYASAIAQQADIGLGAFFREVAEGIISWLDTMRAPSGLYYAALDADSEGEEGKYYVWTCGEIEHLLGERAAAFIEAYSFNLKGNFREESTGKQTGENVPYLRGMEEGLCHEDLRILYAARQRRISPVADDKQLLCWNGLLLRALVAFGDKEHVRSLALAISKHISPQGDVPRQIVNELPSGQGLLEDHAAVALGMQHAAMFLDDASLQERAELLSDRMVHLFFDEDRGTFSSTCSAHERLFGSVIPVFDQPIPSGNSMAIEVLIGGGDFALAKEVLNHLAGWMEQVPIATAGLFQNLLLLLEEDEPDYIIERTAPAPSPQVAVTLSKQELLAENGIAKGGVRLHVPSGWHINNHEPPANWLTPTSIEIQPLEAQVTYPEGTEDRYTGSVEIPFTVRLPFGEEYAEFEVAVGYQCCSESECMLPEEKKLTAVVHRN